MSALLRTAGTRRTRTVGIAAGRRTLSIQSRSVSTYVITPNDDYKNYKMEMTAQYIAKATGTRYIDPVDLNKMTQAERIDALNGEKLHIVAEQRDINGMHLMGEGGVIIEHGACRVVKEIVGEPESIIVGGEIVRTKPLTHQGKYADRKHDAQFVKRQLLERVREGNAQPTQKQLLMEGIPGVVMVQCFGSAAAKAISQAFGVPATGVISTINIKKGEEGILLVRAVKDPNTHEIRYEPIEGDDVPEKIQHFVNGRQSDKPTSLGDLALILHKDQMKDESKF